MSHLKLWGLFLASYHEAGAERMISHLWHQTISLSKILLIIYLIQITSSNVYKSHLKLFYLANPIPIQYSQI